MGIYVYQARLQRIGVPATGVRGKSASPGAHRKHTTHKRHTLNIMAYAKLLFVHGTWSGLAASTSKPHVMPQSQMSTRGFLHATHSPADLFKKQLGVGFKQKGKLNLQVVSLELT